jgi:hypothetical protein
MTIHPAHALYGSVFLPPFIFVVAGTSSLSVGAVVASLLLLAAFPATFQSVLRRDGFRVLLAIGGGLAVLAHLALVATFQSVNLVRAVASLPLLLLLVLAGQVLARAFFADSSMSVDRTCRKMFAVLTLILLIGILDLVPSEGFARNKVIFPFSEPSHFALAYAPFLMYATVQARGWQRLTFLLGAFAMSYLVQNLTLLIACVMASLVCVRAKHLPLVFSVLGVGAATLDLSYFSARLDLGDDSENLSALVYLQGWQLMGESLVRSSYLGLGFQQLGEQPTEVLAAALIYRLSGLELNLSDGGFIGAKLVAEFGAAGLVVVALLGVVSLSAMLGLHREAVRVGRGSPAADVLARSIVASFFLDVYVRGTGYFSGTTLVFFAACLHLAVSRRVFRRGRALMRLVVP